MKAFINESYDVRGRTVIYSALAPSGSSSIPCSMSDERRGIGVERRAMDDQLRRLIVVSLPEQMVGWYLRSTHDRLKISNASGCVSFAGARAQHINRVVCPGLTGKAKNDNELAGVRTVGTRPARRNGQRTNNEAEAKIAFRISNCGQLA